MSAENSEPTSRTSLPDPADDIVAYNKAAWNEQVRQKNRWTVPVTPADIERARNDDWSIILTPEKPVPRDWFPDFRGDNVDVLCLAGAGGQQAPILAAAGANVTVFDNSPSQLEQDELVAKRESLQIRTVQGDMADLSELDDASFDFVVHPCSNGFVPDIKPVWKEASRVMRPGATMISGVINPIFHLFDDELMDQGEFKVAHAIPFSDLTSISAEQRQKFIDAGEPLCFGHTLTDQIGGQIAAGLQVIGFFEDGWSEWKLSEYIMTFIATRSLKSLS
jgi:SAM-dependent methyltransferase